MLISISVGISTYQYLRLWILVFIHNKRHTYLLTPVELLFIALQKNPDCRVRAGMVLVVSVASDLH